ncbi:potassium-transporting ATPase subunit C [Photobacterium kishitanii]|uniref:potassium-transporting ATPase subunit KdpC n=1 Tax=Photobacterium kishitanii TaxID=318456 RepID=UPI000D167FAD|nr:potassium-transporting ATPase subunit KdpC [Photobacterium kishitanii]PSU97773.1 potassium-transporting ATPase subunit C [Photobacterium kishitanii]
MNQLRAALSSFILLFLLVGVVYPGLVYGASQLVFPEKANGSLIYINNKVKGSQLLGQQFTEPKYFQGRPSANQYDAEQSGGSNLSPLSVKFAEEVANRRKILKSENTMQRKPVPQLLLTESGSGLDPDISPAAAYWQVLRIAKSRHISEQYVHELIKTMTKVPNLSFLGQPTVNVLDLNLALDKGE